jgi:release factor glutamine methyltransferase
MHFILGSLFGGLGRHADVIVANLPYVSTAVYQQLAPEIRDYEPTSALHAGSSGTEVIENLLAQAPRWLACPGLLVAEHDPEQAPFLSAAARAEFPNACIETRRDLAGLERVLRVELTDGAPILERAVSASPRS